MAPDRVGGPDGPGKTSGAEEPVSDEQPGSAEGSWPRPSLRDYYGKWFPVLVRRVRRRFGLDTPEAEAVVNEVFAKLVPKWDELLVETLDAYIGRAVHNRAVEVLRSSFREDLYAPEELPEQAAPACQGVEAVAEAREDFAAMLSQLARVHPRYQTLLRMQAEGVPQEEMAKRLGVAPGTMRTALSRARAQISKIRRSDAEDAR